jgi:hypothetical protein
MNVINNYYHVLTAFNLLPMSYMHPSFLALNFSDESKLAQSVYLGQYTKEINEALALTEPTWKIVTLTEQIALLDWKEINGIFNIAALMFIDSVIPTCSDPVMMGYVSQKIHFKPTSEILKFVLNTSHQYDDEQNHSNTMSIKQSWIVISFELRRLWLKSLPQNIQERVILKYPPMSVLEYQTRFKIEIQTLNPLLENIMKKVLILHES